MESRFKHIGNGIVTLDKEEDSYFIEVHLVEQFPSMDGDYNEKEKVVNTFVDSQEVTHTITTEKSKTITCRWLGIHNSNRISAPDVVIGEMVHIFQEGGNDEYFWASTSTNMRKKEKVIYSYANKDSSKPNEDTGEEQYYFMVDTRNKEIVLHTANNDNEKSFYDFVLNTKDAKFSIKDEQGNYYHLESVANDGTFSISINDKIQAKTKHSILDSEEDITTKTKNHSDNNETYVSNTKDTHVINAGTSDIYYDNGDSLYKILLDYLDVHIASMHIGNLGFLSKVSAETVGNIQQIQERIRAIKADQDVNNGVKWEEKNK